MDIYYSIHIPQPKGNCGVIYKPMMKFFVDKDVKLYPTFSTHGKQ